jgi:hypothetical protein
MRSSEPDDDDDETENLASQWIQELDKFAPYLQVWEIFTYADYERILSVNNGVLPPGVHVTYYEGFFTNGAREKVPESWDDEKFNVWCAANGYGPAGELDPDYPRKASFSLLDITPEDGRGLP